MTENTDRELLELAAKAIGIKIVHEGSTARWVGQYGEWPEWNPLYDDGDALRLAVALGVLHEIYVCGDDKVIYRDDFTIHFHECGDDRMAATRRAIVRAAASIGEQMK